MLHLLGLSIHSVIIWNVPSLSVFSLTIVFLRSADSVVFKNHVYCGIIFIQQNSPILDVQFLGRLSYRMALTLDLSDVSPWFDSDYDLLAEIPQNGYCIFLSALYQEAHGMIPRISADAIGDVLFLKLSPNSVVTFDESCWKVINMVVANCDFLIPAFLLHLLIAFLL